VTEQEARRRLAAAPRAHLATVDGRGQPHLVPICFALEREVIYSVTDAKPKRTTALRRLANVAANPRVAVLVDHYSDDWAELWWVRADGSGRIVDAGAPERRSALALLAARYPQYEREPPGGPLLAIDVARWSSWSARGD
jgi:PPOX class probable F420-dependent enzyme